MKKTIINIAGDISINIILITNNYFLASGVSNFIKHYDTGRPGDKNTTKTKCIITAWNIQQSIDYLDLYLYESLKNVHKLIFIVEHTLMPGVSLHLCHFSHGNIFVISANELNFDKIKQLLFMHSTKSEVHINTPNYSLLSRLTSREKRLCTYLYLGYKPKFIGLLLGISEKSVYGYKSRIMKKIGCSRKSEFNKAIVNYNLFCRNNYK